MASEITLKYLHPSIKTYITTENYNYDTSVSREVLFVADVFEHGKDNVLQQVNTLSEYLFKYGEPNLKKFGQAGYNVEKWLTNGGSAVIMRLLPEDASYAHAVYNIQYKNATNGKTVIASNGDETKTNDIYLRPVVTYIGVNNTSEALLESELAEDRSGYPTTDGYVDNFIFAVYPEGRGEYYNDLGFRIRLNPSYDGVLTSRVYTFEVVKFTGSTYDIIDGPYYVTFDPDAIDPNSQKSMFIENVVNSYSEYIKVKVNTENYIKLASVINDEVDPYIIDIISGKSRIINGSPETFYSSVTGKDEDVHMSLRKYSTTGVALTDENGDYILNISNNDETTSDIVDIADNSRRVIYNNQKFVTDYMRAFFNWLIQERIQINLNKIIDGNIESNYKEIKGLLLNKIENLIYAHHRNDEAYTYDYDNFEFNAEKVGKRGRVDSWYLRAQEILHPGLKNKEQKYVGAEVTGFENDDDVYTSSSEMANVITTDGYIDATQQHLISYYHNFMKYMEFVANYDVYNNTGFVISDNYLSANRYFDKIADAEGVDPNKKDISLYILFSSNNSEDLYKNVYDCDSGSGPSVDGYSYSPLLKTDFIYKNNNGKYVSIYDYLTKNIVSTKCYNDNTKELSIGLQYVPSTSANKCDFSNYGTSYQLYPTYVDNSSNEELYLPITDFTTYDSDGTLNKFGKYIKVYNIYGDQIIQPILGTTLTIGQICKVEYFDSEQGPIRSYPKMKYNLVRKYLHDIPESYTSNIFKENILVLYTKNGDRAASDQLTIDFGTGSETDGDNLRYFKEYYDLIKKITTKFNDYNLTNYIIVTNGLSGDGTPSTVLPDVKSYNDYKTKKENNEINCFEYKLTDLIKLINAFYRPYINIGIEEDDDRYAPGSPFECYIPNTLVDYCMVNMSIGCFDIIYDIKTDETTSDTVLYKAPVANIITDFFFNKKGINTDKYNVFDPVFSERLKNGKLSQSYNKVASYATLISKELDGKGKDTIIDALTNKKMEELDYSDYSLTTILNLYVGGFESIVNNMGSITDYSNYSSLKYLIKTINNKLDLRSTYLTLLNVHKNKVLDLSTKLAKMNASVILGDETLDTLYGAMDDIVVESNYLITNIINTLLNKTYRVYDLDSLNRADNNQPYAYYFKNPDNEIHEDIDPLGININISNFGKEADDTYYQGILPLLEKIIINITGENHLGDTRNTIYGGQPLIQMYEDIKEGYVLGGLTQERYENMYKILSESLSYLSDIHNIITAFINEKYIGEIINTLLGTIDIRNTVIKYNGSTYSVNALWDFYNSDANDGSLTQTDVVNMINDALKVSLNTNPLPINDTDNGAGSAPVIAYPYFCMTDIIDSINIASTNKNIVKSNILKQDKVLASLNTLCYDNLVTNIYGPLSLMEGSDGSFTYDDSTAAALKLRQHRINDIRIKAYKGTWNEDVLNKDLFEFDHVLDANYEDPVKNAIITLARDERQDFFYWADTKIQNTVQDCLDWKTGFTNQTYFMSIIAQSQVWYDEYTSRNITLTSTYLIADMLNRHIGSYGIHFPMAGSRRGVVGGFISNDWYPNEEQKEKLYNNKINYLERDIANIRIGAQNTNYPTGPLGQINNMLVLLRVKRTVEKIAKTYQFEFNTADTRSAMAAEINVYLGNWINNGACTVATASVYASDYDIIQKIVRVDVTLQFTGVIERIVINIDCPASI